MAPQAKHESGVQIEVDAPVLESLICGALSWRGTAVAWLQSKRSLALQRFPATSVLVVVESGLRPSGSVVDSQLLSLARFLLRAARNAFPDLALDRLLRGAGHPRQIRRYSRWQSQARRASFLES